MTFREDVNLNCPSCSGWFSEHDRNVIDICKLETDFSTTYYCPCCKDNGNETVLQDAHSYTIQTPIMQIRAEIIKEEIAYLNARIESLEKKLVEELWEDL